MSIRVEDLEFDDANVEHLWNHGISDADVIALLDGKFVVLRNKRGHSGAYKIIGRDKNRHLITVVIVESDVKGRWRPVTGWLSTRGEETLWRRYQG
ncbi:MAG: hypothetical protein HYX92_17160 [Chloroflexi bacterium]|nr:hypothetical protein [Chloroflexota bacterium]